VVEDQERFPPDDSPDDEHEVEEERKHETAQSVHPQDAQEDRGDSPKVEPDIDRRNELLLQIHAQQDPSALAQPQPTPGKMGAVGEEVQPMGGGQLLAYEVEGKQPFVCSLAIGASVKLINFVMEYDEPYEGRLSRTVL